MTNSRARSRRIFGLARAVPLLACIVAAWRGGGAAAQRLAPEPLARPLARGVEARLDSAVRAAMRARDVPGAAVAVLRRDTVVFMRGFGVADRVRGTPVTERTVFQLASTTKPFTATAVLLLAQEGRLGLDDRARTYLPWLSERDSAVTLRQLLTHTAGIPTDVRRANVDEFPIEEFRRRFAEAPARAAPGTRWEYANAGYTLLALVVEKVAAQPFGDFLQARIFGPLGMSRAGYRVPERADEAHATGYDWVEGALQPAPHVFSGWGNSGIEASLGDMVRFAAALARGRLLNAESQREMLTPARLGSGAPVEFGFRDDGAASYGMGWFLLHARGAAVQTHGGVIAGFSSVLTRYPAEGATVIVLCNGKDRGDRVSQAETLAGVVADVLGLGGG
jgi:CubicO group peptidase (beta-lactamase class C family)